MKNLVNLMEEFSILGMEPKPVSDENGLEFAPLDGGMPPTEDEYELDADGNPILDADGNPVKKIKPEDTTSQACSCDHTQDNVGGIGAASPVVPAVPNPELGTQEDEFDFNV